MAECFAQSFSSVFGVSSPDSSDVHQSCQCTIDSLIITPNIVADVLKKLHPNTGTGGDYMHARL